jgi:hypothetical protein
VRQLQEVATANFKLLSRLGISEMLSRGNSDDGKAAGDTLILDSAPSGTSSLASVNEIKISLRRWFPVLSNLP